MLNVPHTICIKILDFFLFFFNKELYQTQRVLRYKTECIKAHGQFITFLYIFFPIKQINEINKMNIPK